VKRRDMKLSWPNISIEQERKLYRRGSKFSLVAFCVGMTVFAALVILGEFKFVQGVVFHFSLIALGAHVVLRQPDENLHVE